MNVTTKYMEWGGLEEATRWMLLVQESMWNFMVFKVNSQRIYEYRVSKLYTHRTTTHCSGEGGGVLGSVVRGVFGKCVLLTHIPSSPTML